jgi:transposase
MNANEYLKVMDMAAINVASSCSLTYMQDNAPIHRARIVTDWLEANDVKVLPWPPYSPDINPIENVWSHIKDTLNRMCPKPTTLAELHGNSSLSDLEQRFTGLLTITVSFNHFNA